MADWSGLPRDLLLKVGKSLESHFDVLHIRSVCSNWRVSIPLKLRPRPTLCLPLPWFPLPWKDTDAIGSFLVKRTTCLFKLPADPGQTSTTPRFLLATLGENRFGKKYITIPLPCEKLRSEIHHPFVLNLDISNLVVQELDSEYYISRLYDNDLGIPIRTAYLNSDLDDNDQFNILTQHKDAGPLHLFKFGDEKGIKIEMEDMGICYNSCVDFIQYKGKFYYTDLKRKTFCIEPSSGASFPVVESSPLSSHLVNSRGNLLLVRNFKISHDSPNHNPVECRVFQLDEEEKKWVSLGSLGGGIVFLGDWYNFFAPAIPGVEGNCIVFLMERNAYVFDMSSRMTVPLNQRPDLYQLFVPPNTSADFGENLG